MKTHEEKQEIIELSKRLVVKVKTRKSFLDVNINEREDKCNCDYLFWLTFDGNANINVVENQFNYCPHCGGKLVKKDGLK